MLRQFNVFARILTALVLMSITSVQAAIVFTDDFEGNLSQWTVISSGGDASIGNETANSGTRSLRLRWNTVAITSASINAADDAAQLRFWLRRGDDSFSENPDNGEDVQIQYRNNSGIWTTLAIYPGSGTPGEIIGFSQSLPSDALYNGLQIRFRLTNASGNDFDYWHVDDVVVETFTTTMPTGLVAEWRFDELSWASSTLEVRDSSGNNYHGIAFNSQPTAGLVCNAADFRAAGTEDYIRLNHESLNGLDDWSISVWVTSNRNAAQTILSASKSDTELNEAVMYFNDASTFWPSVRSNPFFDNNTLISLPYAIDDGNFHHLVWTRNRAASQTCLYLDGSLVGCTTHADGGNTMEVIQNGLVIGQEQDVVGGDFDINQVWVGLIDELVLFDNELTQGEVLYIYNNQLAGRSWNGNSRVCPEALPTEVAYWQMDETTWDGSPGEVIDLSGNGLNMTSFNGAFTNNVDPAIVGDPGTCRYGVFDGVDDYVEIAHDPLLSIANNLSITLWVKPNALPASGLSTILSKDENYEFHVNPSGEIFWWWQTGTLTTSGANLQPGNWYHIGLTFENGDQVIYVNGIERARNNASAPLPQNTDPLQLGNDQFSGGRYFSGHIDEVRIFDVTLTHGQVIQSMLEIHPCTGTTICPFDYTDNFSVQSYSNNDGSKLFTTAWQEVGDNNDAASGDIRIIGSNLRVQNVNRNDPSIIRSADLSQAITAELRIDIRTSNELEGNDRIAIEASADGTSFTTLQLFRNDVVGVFTYDLTPFISPTTAIRFRIERGYLDANEFIEFDSVQINVTEYCGVSYFVLNHDGNGINCLREAVSITAFDTGNNVLTSYNGLVSLSTSTVNGNWFVVDSAGSSSDPAQGNLSDTAGDDNGAATYQFNPLDQGTVTLYFEDTHQETLNFTAADGAATDDNSEGDITFRPFGFLASPAPVATQIAGRPFTVQLTAAGQTPTQPQCGVIEEYTGSKNIHFWSTYNSPNSSPTQMTINGASIATSEPTATPQGVSFTNGVANIQVQYDDVGSISFAAKDETGVGEPTSGNTDEIIGGVAPFVVRPFAYDIQPQGNPNATGAGDPVYAVAGADFTLTIRSVLWQAADDTDSNGVADAGANLADNGITPNIVNVPASATDIMLTPAAQVVTNDDGVLGDSQISFNEFGTVGSATQGTVVLLQNWNEAGIVTIDAATADFMFTAEAVSGARTNIGRFIPDNFLVTITNNLEAQCGSFSYAGFNGGITKSGQLDDITLNIQARNLSNTPTRNYDGVFAMLEAGTLSLSAFNTTSGTPASGTLNSAPMPSPIFDNNGLATGVNITNIHYQFDSLAAEFDLRIDLDATDSDGVNGTAQSAEIEQRLGRLQLQTTYGPENQMLEMPLFTEYYDGSDWVANSADSCTTYTASNIQFVPGTYQGDLNSGETSATLPAASTNLVNGRSGVGEGIWFSAPGVGNSGEVNVEFDLTTFDWLTFDWTGDGNKNNPQATVGFGRFRGSDRVIYWREN